MENYAIQLLQNALNEELRHLATATELTRRNGFKFNNATNSAFNESRVLAINRIPELQNAISKLTSETNQ